MGKGTNVALPEGDLLQPKIPHGIRGVLGLFGALSMLRDIMASHTMTSLKGRGICGRLWRQLGQFHSSHFFRLSGSWQHVPLTFQLGKPGENVQAPAVREAIGAHTLAPLLPVAPSALSLFCPRVDTPLHEIQCSSLLHHHMGLMLDWDVNPIAVRRIYFGVEMHKILL